MTDKKYISELLSYDQIHIRIRTNLCHEIHILRMRIFLSFVTTLIVAAYRWTCSTNWLAWSEGWWPPGTKASFIKWTVNSRNGSAMMSALSRLALVPLLFLLDDVVAS